MKKPLGFQNLIQHATLSLGFTEQKSRLNPALQEWCGTMVAAAERTVGA
ncbi:hypothetical protein [Amycolatopsis sp. lyj-23]